MYSKTSPQWNDGPAKSQICLISRSTLLMPPDLYTHLLENLHSRDDVRKCAESHPHVGYDALLSIYSQKFVGYYLYCVCFFNIYFMYNNNMIFFIIFP